MKAASKKEESMFFSEETNKKTFILWRFGDLPDMAHFLHWAAAKIAATKA
jgi:hypothetical protein